MVQSIINQETTFSQDPTAANPSINDIKRRKSNRIYDAREPSSRRLLDCACEPVASTWLSALPVEEHGFCLSKSSFRDALSLRFGWQLPDLSSKCAYGKSFSVDHAMMCHKGGLPTLRHSEVRDLTELPHPIARRTSKQSTSSMRARKREAMMRECGKLRGHHLRL